MQEILDNLPAGGAHVLDLGCSAGSFSAPPDSIVTVRVDLERPQSLPEGFFVQADAVLLPFRAAIFDAVICNHSLEHIENISAGLEEIGRVARRGGALYVAVPDAGTLTDRIYRWLASGGGHVNPFRSTDSLVVRLQAATGMKHVATRTLFTSFAFLNRRNAVKPRPKRMALFLWGMESALVFLNAALRWMDRRFRTRASVYGWAIYLGNIPVPVDPRPWTNVCVRCGRGHPSDWLGRIHAVKKRWGFFKVYECPTCGAANVYFRDEDFVHAR